MSPLKSSSNKLFGLRYVMDFLDVGRWPAFFLVVLILGFFVGGGIFFVSSAPPKKLVIATGPEGSTFHDLGKKYAEELAKHKVKVEVITSNGSFENLTKMTERGSKIDLAFVQGGLFDEEVDKDQLVSLGVIRHQPLFFFYRGEIKERLAQMKGKKIVVGPAGSGTQKLAKRILALNGMKEEEGDKTILLDMDSKDSAQALIEGKIDGLFMMSGYSLLSDIRRLIRDPDIHLLNFKNAAAYTRKIDYLHILDLHEGVIDLEKNIPPAPVKLIGVMAELIAKKDFHPAMSDLVLDVAKTIHGSTGLFQKRGEFPAPVAHHIKLSDEAIHYYKSGKTFLFRYLPFWVASLVGRLFVLALPFFIVLIPLVRSTPKILRWLGQLKIRRRYRALLHLENRLKNELDPEKFQSMFREFEYIEKEVRNMKVRPAFAEQFYFLRGHIDYVRRLFMQKM
jgi:TRAP transporter TAXI family solute receptor